MRGGVIANPRSLLMRRLNLRTESRLHSTCFWIKYPLFLSSKAVGVRLVVSLINVVCKPKMNSGERVKAKRHSYLERALLLEGGFNEKAEIRQNNPLLCCVVKKDAYSARVRRIVPIAECDKQPSPVR